jgi:hypothetical protein
MSSYYLYDLVVMYIELSKTLGGAYGSIRSALHVAATQVRQHCLCHVRQIEAILGCRLPDTARERPQWWANEVGDTRHVQCRAWMDAGVETRNLNLAKNLSSLLRRKAVGTFLGGVLSGGGRGRPHLRE